MKKKSRIRLPEAFHEASRRKEPHGSAWAGFAGVGTYLPSGCPRRSAAAAGSGCRGWAARRPRTAGFLSRPGWARPSCRPCRSSGQLRRVLRSGPPYLRAFEQLYKKPNNREKKLHLFISAFRKSLVLYDTDDDSSACSSARHQMGLRTKKHDFGIRVTSAQGLHSQMDSHAACYWQVLQLRAPESLSAHPPWHLCFCCGCLRLAVWDLFDLCPCLWKKQSVRKAALSDHSLQQQPWQHQMKSVLLIQSKQRTLINCILKQVFFKLNDSIITLYNYRLCPSKLVVKRWTVMLTASTPPLVTSVTPQEMNSSTPRVTKNTSSRLGIFHKETKAFISSNVFLHKGSRVTFFNLQQF